MLPLRTFFALAILAIGGEPTEQNINVQEFGVLCQLYALAKSAAKNTSKEGPNEEEKIVKEIQDIYTITASNETVFESQKTSIPTELKDKCFRATTEGHRRLIARKFGRILKRVEECKDALHGVRSGQVAQRGLIRTKLVEAVFGTGAEEHVDGTTDFDSVNVQTTKETTFQSSQSASYAKNCGGTGAGTNNGEFAGISLVNDFICLCVAKTGQSGKQCADGVDLSGGDPLDNGQISDTRTKWETLRAACPKFNVRPTSEAIDAALANFHAALGRKPKTGANSIDALARHLLGDASGASDNRCDGDTDGVCVNYHYVMGKSGIPWEINLRAAQAAMEGLRDKNEEEKILIRRLRLLGDQARDLCENQEDTHVDSSTSPEVRQGTTERQGEQNTNQNSLAREPVSSAYQAYTAVGYITMYAVWVGIWST